MAAGVGEEVSRDVVEEFRRTGSDRLRTMRGQGLSDQRVALINRILAERKGQVAKATEQQLVKQFEEPRRVGSQEQVTVLESKIGQKFIEKGFTREGALEVARESVARQRSIPIVEAKEIAKRVDKPIQKDETTTQQTFTVLEAPKDKAPSTKFFPDEFFEAIERSKDRLKTKILREEKLTFKERGQQVILSTLGVVTGSIRLGEGIVRDPVTTTTLVVSGISKIPKKITSGELSKRLKTITPEEAIGEFIGTGGGLFFSAKPTQIIVKEGIEGVSSVFTRLSPKFRTSVLGKIEDIPTTQGKSTILLSERIPTESLAKQARLAGTTQDIVSAQRGLFGIFRGKVQIRKPIPKEELLDTKTKSLLKKLDEGQITPKELIELDKRIKESGVKAKGLLERTFFADPRGRLRPSRLGIRKEREAGLSDILAGDITLIKPKPQALIFPQQKIAKFPPFLRDIEESLLKGIPLTESQKVRLLEWQLTSSSQFKPVGFLTRESEVTAFGTFIKKKKKAAVTLIDGKKVKIFEAELTKLTKESNKLIKKARDRTLSSTEARSLVKKLKKETGIDYSSTLLQSKYVSPTKKLSGIPSSIKITSTSRTPSSLVSIISKSKIKSILSPPSPSRKISPPPTSKITSPPTSRKITPPPTSKITSPPPTIKITSPPPTITTIPPPPPPIRTSSPAKIKALKKALAKLKGKSVDIQVGMAPNRPKMIIERNIAPKRAFNKAQRFIDKQIFASFKLIENPKPPRRKDVRSIKVSPKFRFSKKNPLFQVEKRRFRLDSRIERRQIKQKRRRK